MAAETKGNVLDLTKRIKQKRQEARKNPPQSNEQVIQMPTAVLDMTARRCEMINDERRQVRRTVLSHFIGAFVVNPAKGLETVTIFDISENGISFDLSKEAGKYQEGETVSMRIYLSHELYFPFTVRIANVRPGDGVNRHGGELEKDQPASSTLQHFVKFLEGLATVARKDQGDRILGRAE